VTTADKKCQWGGDPQPCPKGGTHALIVDRVDSGVRMCGPHARDAVITWGSQGERGVYTVKVGTDGEGEL
jgi:hypothetical protein